MKQLYTQSISRIQADARAVSPRSVFLYVTEGESRRATHLKLERRSVYFLFFFAALGGVFLGGCQNWNTPERANDLITDGWVGPTPYPSAATDTRPVYCYRTLGDGDCYSSPQHGWEARLIESYEPFSPVMFSPQASVRSYPVKSLPFSSSSPSLQPMKLNP